MNIISEYVCSAHIFTSGLVRSSFRFISFNSSIIQNASCIVILCRRKCMFNVRVEFRVISFCFTPFAHKWNDIIIIFGGPMISTCFTFNQRARHKINRWRDHYGYYHIYYSIVNRRKHLQRNYNFPLMLIWFRALHFTTHFIELKRNANWFYASNHVPLICRRLVCINCATGNLILINHN